MKLRELAEKYGVDVTELSCAVSVAAGKELAAEDEVEITAEVVDSVKDFLGIDLSQELVSDSSEDQGVRGNIEGGEKEGSGPSEEKESSLPQGEEKDGSRLGEKESEGPVSKDNEKIEEKMGEVGSKDTGLEDVGDSGEESGGEPQNKEEEEEREDVPDEVRDEEGKEVEENSISDEKDSPVETEDEKKEEDSGETSKGEEDKGDEQEDISEKEDKDIGGTAETGQEKGSSHQEVVQEGSSRGDAEEAVQEEAEEETLGGDEVVPEGVGDERSILLGDSAPPSSQSTKEEKIPLDKVKIKEQVVKPDQDIPVPSNESTEGVGAVPVQTVESPVQENPGIETQPVTLPKFFVYSLLGMAFLSVALLAIGVYKVSTVDKKTEASSPLSNYSYSDAELFAVMFRMIAKGDYASAQDLFEELKTKFPNSKFLDDASICLGDVFFNSRVDLPDQERYKEAIKYYQFAYDISPRRLNKEKALLRVAHSYYRMGQYEPAINKYKAFLEEFYFSKYIDEARYYLAMSLLSLNRYLDAEKEFWTLVREGKDANYRPLALYQLVKYYFSNNQWSKVQEVAPLFIKEYPKNDKLSEVLFMYADALISAGQIDKAIEAYEASEKNLSETLLPNLYIRKGEAYEKKQDIASAIKVYLEMARRFKYNELSADALYRAARLLKDEGKLNEAVNALYELKERFYKWDKLPEALFLLSQVLAQKGEFRDAEKWLRQILKKFPNYPKKDKVYWYIARMLELQGRYKDAVRVYDKLLRITAKENKGIRLKIYLAKADALMRSKQYHKAIGVFASVLTEFKKYSKLDRGKILYRLSIAYFYNGDYAKAIESFKDAIKNSPISPWRFKCRYMLGRTYEESGQIQEAIDQYSRIANNRFLGDRKLKSLSWEALGRIYLRLEKYDEAFSALKNARELATDWWRLTELLRLQADALLGKKDFGSALKLYVKYLTRILSAYDAELKDDNGKFSLVINRKSPEAFDKIMEALTRIGDINYRAGKYGKALRVYKKVKGLYEERDLKPTDWVLYQIGMCYKMLEEWPKAVAFFDRVIEEYPDSIWAREAHWQKNQMQIMEKLNQAEEVLKAVEK